MVPEGFDSIQSLLQQVHAGAKEPTAAKKDDVEEREKERERFDLAVRAFVQESEAHKGVQKRLKKFRREGVYAYRPWQWAGAALTLGLLVALLVLFVRTISNEARSQFAVDEGVRALIAGRTSEGLESMQRAINFGADTVAMMMEFAAVLEDLEQKSLALELYAAATEIAVSRQDFENMVRGSLAMAEIRMDEGRFTDAAGFVQKILTYDPKQKDALILQGRIFLQESKFDHARDAFFTALERNPASHTPRFYLREAYLRENRFDDAQEQEDIILFTQPSGDEDYQTNIGYADLLRRDNRLREAKDVLEKVRRGTRTSRPEILVSLGHLAVEMLDFEAAQRYADSAVLAASSFPDGYVLRGEINYQHGRRNDAYLDFRKALELDPLHPKGSYDMGCLLLYDLGNPSLALHHFERARQSGFAGPFLMYNIGVCHHLMRRPREAMQAYDQAPSYLDNSGDFLWSYAVSAVMSDQVDTALKIFLGLREKNDRNPALENNLGIAMELSGDTVAAIQRYWAAVEMAATPISADTIARANIERVLAGRPIEDRWESVHTAIKLRLSDVVLPGRR